MTSAEGLNRLIINGDSIDELRKIKDRSIDLVILDPPIGRLLMKSGTASGKQLMIMWSGVPYGLKKFLG